MTDAKQKWAEFLHPTTLRDKLMSISLYITCYEMMKDHLISNVRSFFLTGFNEDGFIYNEEGWNEVLRLDPNKNTLKAILIWYRNMGAITDEDVNELNRQKQLRDELAHNPQGYIGGSSNLNLHDRFTSLVNLFRKIEVWWVMNVEIYTDPDITPEYVNEDSILPGSIMLIQIMLDIALGNEDEANYYYRRLFEDWNNI